MGIATIYATFQDAFDFHIRMEYRFRYARGDDGFRLEHFRITPRQQD